MSLVLRGKGKKETFFLLLGQENYEKYSMRAGFQYFVRECVLQRIGWGEIISPIRDTSRKGERR